MQLSPLFSVYTLCAESGEAVQAGKKGAERDIRVDCFPFICFT